ncbi:unnamed protein product [Arabis nemorensis]|uniref:NYN domain-containing protein n=1 Tax=Arabis nemorensis TaxID=586526 RepID=A0A565C249_9BRAS|nr:unnamed protein product [Arabis nemorensis]
MPFPFLAACVFWDTVDFPFPHGLHPEWIYRRTKDFLEGKGYLGAADTLLLKAYIDEKNFPDGYRNDKVTLLPIPIQGGKYTRADTMLVDIVLWAMENPATYHKPVDLMVISANVKEGSDFLHALESLQDRQILQYRLSHVCSALIN